MKHYQNPERTAFSFQDRVGDPDNFSSALGRIAFNFSQLEDQVSASITELIGVAPAIGNILTAELSFKNKVNVLASLVHQFLPTTAFNTGDADANAQVTYTVGIDV